MKILITTDTYFPMINGVVISVNNLYRELKAMGHDVRILTLSNNTKEKVEGDVYYLKSITINIYPDARIKRPFSNKLSKELIEWGPDVVHSQTEFSTMLMARHIVKKTKAPHIHTYHTMYEDYLKYLFGGKIITKRTMKVLVNFLLNSVDGVIVPTKKVEKALSSYGVKTGMHIVPTGIDLSQFENIVGEDEKRSILNKYKIPLDSKLLVYVGRVAEEKNISEIINFYTDISKELTNTNLLIVGGGPHLEVLQQEVRDLGMEKKIKFTGMVAPADVYKYYQIGHAFVTASTSETQGLTYIEALASGCPVICRWDASIKNLVVNGDNGYTYETEREFTNAVKTILDNEPLRQKLCENAIEKAQEYSCRTFADRVERLYRLVCRTELEKVI